MPSFGSLQTRLLLASVSIPALLIWLAVLALPDGRQLLIDGGPSPTDLNWRLGQQMPFWDRTLELVVNTHPDADHLGGLVSLPDCYRLAQVLVTDVEAESQLFQEWEAELAEDHLRPLVGQAGMQLALGSGITATLISPSPALAGINEPNNRSLVLHLQYGQISFLLPGDIEAEVERRLVHSGVLLLATVLKSPHHGSKTSSTEAFLAAAAPLDMPLRGYSGCQLRNSYRYSNYVITQARPDRFPKSPLGEWSFHLEQYLGQKGLLKTCQAFNCEAE